MQGVKYSRFLHILGQNMFDLDSFKDLLELSVVSRELLMLNV
jgi:hypothetical protein